MGLTGFCSDSSVTPDIPQSEVAKDAPSPKPRFRKSRQCTEKRNLARMARRKTLLKTLRKLFLRGQLREVLGTSKGLTKRMEWGGGGAKLKNFLMLLFLMGCFPENFQEAKRPPRA